MDIKDKRIDSGKPFDWGKASADYAVYRDIYPEEFYLKLLSLGVGTEGQRVLDTGTGTGVLPRNLYRFGGRWSGTDISAEQIAHAKALSQGMDIDYHVCPEKQQPFESGTFDAVTACQCFWYFDHEKAAAEFSRLLKPEGRLVLAMMNWLPFEDEIAASTEELVLKYNPEWSGGGDTFKEITLDSAYDNYFETEKAEVFRLKVRFTRESWNGRIRACRGIGASSLTEEQKEAWEHEHLKMLEAYPEKFEILHYAAFAVLKKR